MPTDTPTRTNRLSAFSRSWLRTPTDGSLATPRDANASTRRVSLLPQSWRRDGSFDTASMVGSDLSQMMGTTPTPSLFEAPSSVASFKTQATTPPREGTPKNRMPAYKREWTLPMPHKTPEPPAPSEPQKTHPAGGLPIEATNLRPTSSSSANVVEAGAIFSPVGHNISSDSANAYHGASYVSGGSDQRLHRVSTSDSRAGVISNTFASNQHSTSTNGHQDAGVISAGRMHGQSSSSTRFSDRDSTSYSAGMTRDAGRIPVTSSMIGHNSSTSSEAVEADGYSLSRNVSFVPGQLPPEVLDEYGFHWRHHSST